MKPTNQHGRLLPDKPGTILPFLVFTFACLNDANAQENIQTETRLKAPAQRVEQIDIDRLDKEKTEQDDKARANESDSIEENKAISPSDLKQNEAVSPSNSQGSDKLPAVQRDSLPESQRDKLPAVQRDKLPAVQDPHPISDDPVESPFADGSYLPNDAGKPDTGGFVAEPPPIDKAELAIITGPTWRWDEGTRSAGLVLYYGHHYEVSFVVENLGDQPAHYRPKYEIGNALIGFPERTIEPGETQRITWDVPFGPSSHGTEVRRRIMEDEEIDTRVFLAEAERGAGVYADSNVSNNVSRRSWNVRRRLRLHVQLQRLYQYERCDRWVRDRDWQLWTYLSGTEEGRAHLASLDGNPAFLDTSVKATKSLGPLGYHSLVKPDADEVGFSVRVYGLKEDGSIKNRGRTAVLSMTHSLRSLMEGRVSREVRSTEPNGSFCGEGNLGIDVLMWLTVAPYK